MATLQEILNTLLTSPTMKPLAKMREVRELPGILNPGEMIENAIKGTYNKGMGLLVATNKRVIFIDKGMVWGLKVEDFPLEKITSIQYETGMLLAKLKIFTSGNTAVIDNLQKKDAKEFGEYLRGRISQAAAPLPERSETPEDFISKLERLATLKDKGVITESEFQAQKARLLS